MWLWAVTAAAVLVGVGFRFLTNSPLWLDEALSVNIASLPLGDIPEALRHDGHPPLYYGFLHGWMELFGSDNVTIRVFSGLWSVALLPVTWVATRRIGGKVAACYGVALMALSPFAIRYATETRMYSMMSTLALVGFVVVVAALHRADLTRLAPVAIVTALLMWTHYWAFWFVGVAGLIVLERAWRLRRRGQEADASAALKVFAAMAVGVATFAPWLPSLAYQGSHTGTPWARPMRPAEILTNMLVDFGGGVTGEATVLGWFLFGLAVIGVFGRAAGERRIELDLDAPEATYVPAILVAGTLAVGCVAGYVSGATFASRYAAVIHPFLVVLAALALAHLRPKAMGVAGLATLALLGSVGMVRNVTVDRSDARRNVDAIDALAAPNDIVVYCPDQLGPSHNRLLRDDLRQVTYPQFGEPELVDWVDYQAGLDATDPGAFATELVERAGDGSIWLVYSVGYETHSEICPALFNAISEARPSEVITSASEAFENAGVAKFPPA